MNFIEIATNRQSCRNYDSTRPVEEQKIRAILDAAILSPSACNGQPYHFTVLTGKKVKSVAKATISMGLNKFSLDAPVIIVISEKPYVKTAAIGAKLKNNDYRSIDIGIAAAYLTAEATAQGLSTCILGWLDNKKVMDICELDGAARLVITVGYAHPDDKLRNKKRKSFDELVTVIDD